MGQCIVFLSRSFPEAQPQPQAQNVQCNWVANTGGDGTPMKIGNVDRNNPNVCATECYKKSQSGTRGISGAVIVHEDLSCYCMVGMTKTVANNKYTSCVFKGMYIFPPVSYCSTVVFSDNSTVAPFPLYYNRFCDFSP